MPKLLHMFAQVSQLCATLQENPNSIVCLTAGEVLLKHLINFRQWFDLVREPFASSEELFEVCKGNLNEKGYVENDHLVAALTAEAYVHAAQAYLLCRLFRLSRKHTEVQKRSTALRRCVTYVLVNHVIYVAQDSIYSIAMLGILAMQESDRSLVSNRHHALGEGQILNALDNIWRRIDDGLLHGSSEDVPLSERQPWWE